MIQYVELHAKSNFSFLEGASHAHEIVEQAQDLGYAGIAITDRNSLAGVVRGYTAAKDATIPYYVGAELNFTDGPSLLVWPQNRTGYGALCRLITTGRSRAEKGTCALHWSDLDTISQNNIVGFVPDSFAEPSIDQAAQMANAVAKSQLAKEIFNDRLYIVSHLHRGIDDQERLKRTCEFAKHINSPMVATGDVLYHTPERMVLQDCLTAIATGSTIDAIASARPPNAQRSLRPLKDLQRLYQRHPAALSNSLEIASRLEFRLDQLKYEYPREITPEGLSPIEFLKRLAWKGAKSRYNNEVPSTVIEMLRYELKVIEDLKYEHYFLTVWDLVRFARSRNILCQGRGSAANSAVCFCIGVTSVDPSNYDLLFERFISRERNEAPDIDVDFEHQRREEVIQYVYEKYGRDRAGMTAAVTTYRTRSAVRDCGKAVGISQDCIDRLAKIVDGRGAESSFEDRCLMAGIDTASPLGKRFQYLVQSILGFPRHLSQHTGGMVMTTGLLSELCPIENASMPDRTIIQWDKDDLDELGILKVDCLALGMLSAIHRSFDLLQNHYARPLTLVTIPAEDSAVYDMICKADTIGVFQIESRAQMSMLPRLQPRTFYDLVIEVAIVRPGPIQGQMVHPYLTARRTGVQPTYPTEEIAQVLRKTMGVPLFQEQAMRLAVVAAGFTPDEADQLRRAMAAWRRPGIIDNFRKKLVDGMQTKGLTEDFANHVFNQLRGFGEYGFPESHAASFALLVYASCWIKHFYPEVFCCAMLNSQPLGFYAPAQLVQDAQRHGTQVLKADVNFSAWNCTLERSDGGIASSNSETKPTQRFAMRLGLCMIRGLKEEAGNAIYFERVQRGAYRDQNDLAKRLRLSQATLSLLAESGALQSLSGDRRAAYWQSLATEKSSQDMPLFQLAGVDDDEAIPEGLTKMHPIEEVYSDYRSTGLSLQGHPIAFFRNHLRQHRVTTAKELAQTRNGRFVRVAGLIILRQRPSTAKGITFVTMEDETGPINLVIKPEVWEAHYLLCKQSNAWLAHGVLENREGVIHVVIARIEDLQSIVGAINSKSRDFR